MGRSYPGGWHTKTGSDSAGPAAKMPFMLKLAPTRYEYDLDLEVDWILAQAECPSAGIRRVSSHLPPEHLPRLVARVLAEQPEELALEVLMADHDAFEELTGLPFGTRSGRFRDIPVIANVVTAGSLVMVFSEARPR